MRGCLAIPLVFGTLLALTTASYWSYGSNEERCEADLKVIRKNIILLKSTIIHLKAKIAKLPYRPKPGEETNQESSRFRFKMFSYESIYSGI